MKPTCVCLAKLRDYGYFFLTSICVVEHAHLRDLELDYAVESNREIMVPSRMV